MVQNFGMREAAPKPPAKRGPKVKDEADKRKHRSYRMFPRHWAKIDLAGRLAFEAYMDAWQPEPPAAPKKPVG